MQAQQRRRIPWTTLISLALVGVLATLAALNWPKIRVKSLEALALIEAARPFWLLLAILAILAGFLCAGQIYGRVLAALGYRAPPLWLSAAALVTMLLSQALPVGTVASYAFLTTSLRRRHIPATSVAVIASLELLSWGGAMLLLFVYGMVYVLATTSDSTLAGASLTGFTTVGLMIGVYLFIGSRPRDTMLAWAMRVKRLLDRLFGSVSSETQVRRMVDELAHNRQLVLEQPLRVLSLIGLQLIIFTLHSLALLAILHGLGVTIGPLEALAAFGLSLIVSAYTLLPAGGGTVEAALTVALTIQGVPLEAALGATVLFRLFSFWLMLPVAALCYRLLLRRVPEPPAGN
ncbi:MAG TPA: lysylphosphatidylglycerol synthase transmembrane domain-containing protein [Kouleothrix sp.]|uniref:lysylphosphatidylglycerol synthase transmembrane domain-containing protein n=1 Tax=Kouleothrix sp. TaxID=2779161 RepID=UPI002C1042C3|nr:lysylphosphatidylglycerol synthase transmembrane domain-containing protein [Kouleothrix sp.]